METELYFSLHYIFSGDNLIPYVIVKKGKRRWSTHTANSWENKQHKMR